MRAALPSALFAAALLGGCADAMVARDTVTLRAGNALNANRAIMAVDPQAARANNTHIGGDGVVTANVMQNYRRRPGAAPLAPPAEPDAAEAEEGRER